MLRYARTIRLQYVHRLRSTEEHRVPDENRTRFSALIDITEEGHATLTAPFKQALDDAAAAAKLARNQQQGVAT